MVTRKIMQPLPKARLALRSRITLGQHRNCLDTDGTNQPLEYGSLLQRQPVAQRCEAARGYSPRVCELLESSLFQSHPCVPQILLWMNTIYKPGDRVITTVKGAEVEATIVQVTIDIAVKTADGATWWRAISRLRPATGELAGEHHTEGAEQPQPIMDAPLSAAPVESQAETTREEIFGEPTQAVETHEEASPTQSTNGMSEAVAQGRGSKRKRKR